MLFFLVSMKPPVEIYFGATPHMPASEESVVTTRPVCICLIVMLALSYYSLLHYFYTNSIIILIVTKKKGEWQSISLKEKKNHFCDSALLNEARPLDSSGTTWLVLFCDSCTVPALVLVFGCVRMIVSYCSLIRMKFYFIFDGSL